MSLTAPIIGGKGNDTYVIDSLADTVTGGLSAVQASAQKAQAAAGGLFERAVSRVQDVLPIKPASGYRTVTPFSSRLDSQRRAALAMTESEFAVQEKSLNKEEFVTCGGVRLGEVDFKTMQSRVCPGLYFAGELLDIDGITGGFNFQAAWTTGWLAGNAMAAQV